MAAPQVGNKVAEPVYMYNLADYVAGGVLEGDWDVEGIEAFNALTEFFGR
jgi:hypothetical protein